MLILLEISDLNKAQVKHLKQSNNNQNSPRLDKTLTSMTIKLRQSTIIQSQLPAPQFIRVWTKSKAPIVKLLYMFRFQGESQRETETKVFGIKSPNLISGYLITYGFNFRFKILKLRGSRTLNFGIQLFCWNLLKMKMWICNLTTGSKNPHSIF